MTKYLKFTAADDIDGALGEMARASVAARDDPDVD